jgi:DivIVA domain-containing protein
VSDLLPRVAFPRLGYDREQVEEFLAGVRAAYERPAIDPNGLAPLDIRKAAFDLEIRGYSPAAVDAALDRLEEALAARIRQQFIHANGQEGWNSQLAMRAEVLYGRLRRPAGQRFSRPRGIGRGYKAKSVDALLDRITAFFDRGEPLTAADLRTATFSRVRKGRAYREAQVDAYLARAVDILLGVQ